MEICKLKSQTSQREAVSDRGRHDSIAEPRRKPGRAHPQAIPAGGLSAAPNLPMGGRRRRAAGPLFGETTLRRPITDLKALPAPPNAFQPLDVEGIGKRS